MQAQVQSSLPESRIVIRSISTDFSRQHRNYWFFGNPYLTHLVNALSFQFPSGEDMFVKSVNRYKGQIQDKDLKRAIGAFTGQELLHSHVHQEFNEWIASKVPDAKIYCEKIEAAALRRYERDMRIKPILSLAATVALEHMTAIFAASLLRKPHLIESIDPEVRPLLVWHAIEEIEHKDVAFDVYQAIGGSYALRALSMIFATLVLAGQTLFYQFKMLRKDKQVFNIKAALQFLKLTWGRNGYFTSVIGDYLSYFSPRFHPSQTDDRALVDEWSKKLEDMTYVRVTGRV